MGSIKNIILNGTNANFLVYPASDFKFHLGRQVHKVPDDIAMLKLVDDLCYLYGDDWFACLILGNGRGVMKTSKPLMPYQLGEDRRQWAMDLAERLNKELDAGGHWVTGFDGGQNWFMLFRDADGDLQFEISGDDPWVRMKEWPVEVFLKKAYEAGLKHAEVIFKQLGVKPDEMIRRAQGERPTLTTVQ